ncbi:MAG TPA: hypothetical protein VLF94_02340 [Chlamydiales bacterium]|nr:hypothetical protein [Chlamydiales bacterium]
MLTLLASLICLFQPPADWEIAHLKTPSPEIHIGFLAKGSGEFRPSINLATEEIDGTLKEYVKAVKELHLSEPKVQWRDLGKFATRAGEGRLTEVTKPSAWGEMKIFQAIVVKDDTAYILTSAVLKKDLSRYHTSILNAFRSLNLVPDLWTPIHDSQKRQQLQELFATLGQSEDKEGEKVRLQQAVSQTELGPYWQFLALKEGLAKLDK